MVIEAQESVFWERPLEVLWCKAGTASTVGQVTQVPVQNSTEVSKDRDSPASLGILCVHIHCQSGIIMFFQTYGDMRLLRHLVSYESVSEGK